MNKALVIIMFSLFFFTCGEKVIAQEAKTESIDVKKETPASLMEHSPKKATLYSAILPGLGQAYNKKYWKIPVIYAGFAGCSYLIISNMAEHKKFVDAYVWWDEGRQGDPPNEYATRYTKDNLLNGQYQYRRSLELSIIATLAWYGLNIIDATVDAHFFNFDISEELTLKWQPVIIPTLAGQNVSGISLTLKF